MKRAFTSPVIEELEHQQLAIKARWPLLRVIIALVYLLGLPLTTFILRATNETVAELDLGRSVLLAVALGCTLAMITMMIAELYHREAKERWDERYRSECLRIIEGNRPTDQQQAVLPTSDGSDEEAVDQKTEDEIATERRAAEEKMIHLLGTLSFFGVHLGKKRGLPN